MEWYGITLEEWHIWVLLGILFFIIEIFTPAFVAACLGIGFLFGGVASALELSYTLQLVFFSVGVAASFFLVRPFILKIGYQNAENVKTNIDNMVGKKGQVVEEINAMMGTGYVKIDGDQWKAISENKDTIEKGAMVEIVKMESIIASVRKINN